jgi:hypothetical protein
MHNNRSRLIFAVAAWIITISGAHLALNVDWSALFNERRPLAKRKLNVAYIPVT